MSMVVGTPPARWARCAPPFAQVLHGKRRLTAVAVGIGLTKRGGGGPRCYANYSVSAFGLPDADAVEHVVDRVGGCMTGRGVEADGHALSRLNNRVIASVADREMRA